MSKMPSLDELDNLVIDPAIQGGGIDPEYPDAPSLSELDDLTQQGAPSIMGESQPAMSSMDKLSQYGARIVFTGADGSQVIQLPNGNMQVINESQGYSSTNPETVKAVMAGAPAEAIIRRGESENIMQQAPAGAVAAQFLEQAPFVGSYIGELTGKPEQMDRLAAAFRETNPKTATGVGIAGAITAGALEALPAAKLLKGKQIFDAIMRMPNWKKYMSLALTGAGVTGAEDIIYRAGTPDEAGQRVGGVLDELGQAAVPAGIGAGANVLFPLAGSVIAKGYERVKGGLLRTDLTDIQKQFGVSKESAIVIRDAFRDADELDVLLNNIKRAGDKGMIADADGTAQAILDTVIAVDASAGRIATQAVEGRAKEAGQELGKVMDESILPQKTFIGEQGETVAADTVDYARAIADRTRPIREKAYNKYYTTPIDYAASTGRAIEATLGRVPTDLMQKAIKIANAEMRMSPTLSGTRQIMADIADDGKIVFQEMPNPIQLDYIKRALGDVAYSKAIGKDAMGEIEQRQAQKIYSELNKAIGEASPSYRRATNLGGDKIARERALEIGQDVLNPNVTPTDFYRQQKNFTEGQRLFMRAGLRSTIEDTMNKARATINSPDVDINALRNTLSQLSSKSAQNKMKTVVGSDNANKLFKELDRLQAALELRAAVAQNSKTAQRLAVKGRVEELTEGGSLEALAMGRPLEATQRAVQAAAGVTKEMKAEQQSKILRELAKAMTEKKGEAAQQGMRVIYDAVRKNQASEADYQKAFEFMIDSVKLPAYVFGTEAAVEGYINE
jgi:hypothetical protein